MVERIPLVLSSSSELLTTVCVYLGVLFGCVCVWVCHKVCDCGCGDSSVVIVMSIRMHVCVCVCVCVCEGGVCVRSG